MSDPIIDNVLDTIGDQVVGRRLPRALTPFRVPAYRWLALSLTFGSLAGGLWVVALVWEVFRLDGGPAQLSLVSTLSALGVILPALLAGVVADRVRQKYILLAVIGTETTIMAVVAALAATGMTSIAALGVAAFVIGTAMAFYYPAYSAMLPSLIPAEDLMAVNGFEGMVRPTIGNAVGPGIAGVLIGLVAPWAAFTLAAVCGLGAWLAITRVPLLPKREPTAGDGEAGEPVHPIRSAMRDMREGFVYLVRTPWLKWSLLFASLMILAMMGPLEVLIPWFIKSDLGGSAGDHSLVLAAFGIGGALGSLVMSSMRMPRHYLTVMMLMWAFAGLPFGIMAEAGSVWTVVVGALLMGALFSAPMVIWGTLLQRRVPTELLGRVSSLDFFVSIALMPISMALAGPVSDLIGIRATFWFAALAPLVIGLVILLGTSLRHDEVDHPLS